MSSTSAEKRPSNAGPKGAKADVRGSLLRMGHSLYEERGLDQISLRDVADRAGVNQAMVRYYFKDRQGFLTAMLDDGFEQLFGALPSSGTYQEKLEALISQLSRMHWLAVLMMQCVYTSDQLREHFVTRHAPRIFAFLREALDFRGDLDPTYKALSLLSMLVFPQLARPAVGPVMGIKYDDDFSRGYAAYLTALFAKETEIHD